MNDTNIDPSHPFLQPSEWQLVWRQSTLDRIERELAKGLRAHCFEHDNQYDDTASADLTRMLFTSLADTKYLEYFFPSAKLQELNSKPSQKWRLSEAQGAVEGSEYTESARGKRCGHIFRSEEATYSCRTCQADPTCVLCTKCFHASDHEGHQVYVQMSAGTTGCCDCGDEEAWTRPIQCGIHTRTAADTSTAPTSPPISNLPAELQWSIERTISTVMDFLLDVFSCCPEDMRSPKTEEAIREDEEKSRLNTDIYGVDWQDDKFALLLWNDEKHSVDEVAEQVAKACKKTRRYGRDKAGEVDEIGRSLINRSTDLKALLKQARILAQIKVTITIRSTRDIYREEMCHTIVQWLADIAGCSVAGDSNILMDTVCRELLRPWRQGSSAFNMQIARNGIVDQQRSDSRLENMRRRLIEGQAAARLAARQQAEIAALAAGENNDENAVDLEEMDVDTEAEVDMMQIEFANPDELIDALTAANEGPQTENLHDSDDDAMTGAGILPAGSTAPLLPAAPQAPSAPLQSSAPPQPLNPGPRQLITGIPQTPRKVQPSRVSKAPAYWLETPEQPQPDQEYALHERMDQRVRLDSLILYDLRMWKTLRYSLSHLYISTVVTVPSFKRTLGLRFASLYTPLAQLYLVADREPEHSIIHLSLQMLTTPTITAEIVQRSNFLTRLTAILYTFLTKRQVGNPEEVDVSAPMSFESGVISNRRIFHFFQDMRYLLDSPYVQDRICHEPQYLSQFLDFARLSQGICATTRAVGEHVEYESETWYTAGNIVRDITRLSRQFCESFKWHQSQDASNICRALRQTAKAAIISSLGLEHEKYPNAEHKGRMVFKLVRTEGHNIHLIPDFQVENSTISFHHALHYTLSWLIDAGKSMSSAQLKNLLSFDAAQLEDRFTPAQRQELRATTGHDSLGPHDYMLALFDIPLRVCVWMAQMRAGMWVRNGMSLRHQMHFYRGVGHRDVSHRRDLYLLQVAAVVCDPTTFLASILDRYPMGGWMITGYHIKEGYEDWGKIIDMIEDMLHLLIVLLTDRILLLPVEQDPNPTASVVQQELIQTLCFKPLTFSELTSRLSDKVTEHEQFQTYLDRLTIYKAPEGISDSGTFSLKEECIPLVDPYSVYYNKGQREDSEKIWREYTSKKVGIPADQLVYQPVLQKIESGIFKDLTNLTKTPLFCRVLVILLHFMEGHSSVRTQEADDSRLEGLLNTLLHLLLVAVLDDKISASTACFTDIALSSILTFSPSSSSETLYRHLLGFMQITVTRFPASRHRFMSVINAMKQVRPQEVDYHTTTTTIENGIDIDFTDWLKTYLGDNEQVKEEASLKKKQAQERQAKVMAAFKKQQNDFMQQNRIIDWGFGNDDDGEDDDMMADVQKPKTISWPQGTCIFCQEEVTEQQLYGTLGFVAESNIFRTTDLGNAELVKEVLTMPESLDHAAHEMARLNVTEHSLQHDDKMLSDDEATTEQQQSVGAGFPRSQHQSGPVATGCGHVMHFDCFQTYEASTIRRHSYQITRNHPEDSTKSEFICPICKALGNTFLPIVWKPKACATTPERDDESFLIFMRDIAPIAMTKSVGAHRDASNDHAERSYMTCLAVEYSVQYSKRRQSIDDSAALFSGRWASAHSPTRPSASTDEMPDDVNVRQLNRQSLKIAYQRLLKTLSRNNLLAYKFSDASHSDALVGVETITKLLGYSVASVEIAQRGLDGENNYIGSIPEYVTTNLRIWSETVLSYFIEITSNLHDTQGSMLLSQQAFSLFCSTDKLRSKPPHNDALLCQDIFVYLAGCSIGIIPLLELQFGDVLRLCYLAEIVKVVLAMLRQSQELDIDSMWSVAQQNRNEQHDHANVERFSMFVQHIMSLSSPYASYADWMQNPNERIKLDAVIRSMVSTYALQFLRQSALLVHVRYGVDFAVNDHELDSQPESELDRLTLQLGLPTVDEMVHIALSDTLMGQLLQQRMDAWIKAFGLDTRKAADGSIQPRWKPYDATTSHHQTPSFLLSPPTLALSHPAIYELISLPRTHDTLNALAMTHHCPTTGGPLDDPSICLFCGTFVCTQSRCCHRFNKARRQEEGGLFVHREQCGGNVGIFLNIRKCAVLALHNNAGSWFVAPYLDRYGETDLGLRRKEQLFLNKKRYDKLYREVWLRQGVPTMIARKLDAEINAGGWEVM